MKRVNLMGKYERHLSVIHAFTEAKALCEQKKLICTNLSSVGGTEPGAASQQISLASYTLIIMVALLLTLQPHSF